MKLKKVCQKSQEVKNFSTNKRLENTKPKEPSCKSQKLTHLDRKSW